MKWDGGIGILGVGSYVPDKIITNFELEKMVDTSDEWITTRTGIKERRIADSGIVTSDFAVEAGKRAMEDAGIGMENLSAIIVATITGDYLFPATACVVQNKLGMKHGVAFDISAACSGFIFGLATACAYIKSGIWDKVLVIGAEKLSSVTDWQDRNTCVLLGDGAGGVIVGKVEEGRGILGFHMGTDGEYIKLLYVPAGGAVMPASKETVEKRLHYMKMEGREVFKHAVTVMCESCVKVLEECGIKSSEVDLLIPHQANIRIINSIAKRLGLSEDKVFVNLQKYGNTSAASIPLALDEAVKNGRIGEGALVLFVSFGAGLTWGAMVIRL